MMGRTREAMDFDILIIGGGPAGLSAAIRLKQISTDLKICLVEKGSEIGAHILAGAVIEPKALRELIPDWQDRGAPISTRVNCNRVVYLTRSRTLPIPLLSIVMPYMKNRDNYVGSLGDLCRWLAHQAESLGVEIYSGFAGVELLFNEKNCVYGVAMGDMGIGKNGEPISNFSRGIELRARYTLLAEGCRGSLSKVVMARYNLQQGKDPQTYGLGIKELWEIPAENHRPGFVQHSFGWPLDDRTYGGSWLYHFGRNLVSYGFVVGLDYVNPWLSPFEECQRLKYHPAIGSHLKGGRRIGYGARALSEGGVQSIPRLTFPGGMLVGDCAGFLNVPKIKGIHTAMKSGMLAAESIIEAWDKNQTEPISYSKRLKSSWIWDELKIVRNIRPAFSHYGNTLGAIYSVFDAMTRGLMPWTLRHKNADYSILYAADKAQKISYPKPDNELTFDRLSSVHLANISYEHDQPPHLILKDPLVWLEKNWNSFQSPESRYCPAGVYEAVEEKQGIRLHINAQNCVHCKTCDIKDPLQNIQWEPPEGGSGPNYCSGM